MRGAHSSWTAFLLLPFDAGEEFVERQILEVATDGFF